MPGRASRDREAGYGAGEGRLSVFEERKIDCHAHVFDPARFPYGRDIAYKPEGQEIGPLAQLLQVMDSYRVSHVLLVQPNSGYGSDNGCMLDAIRRHPGRFRGVAIVGSDATMETLRGLQAQGVVGIAINPTFHGTAYYRDIEALMEKLAELGMFAQFQCEHDQLLAFVPAIRRVPVRVMIDHCGRPTPADGLRQDGFAALLGLADTGRVFVKLSGYSKFSADPYPFEDTVPFVGALLDAFTPHRCMWASDWPFLRAAERQDYGPLLTLAERLLPDPQMRHAVMWETPRRLFGFGAAA